jgi:hypothetical protein
MPEISHIGLRMDGRNFGNFLMYDRNFTENGHVFGVLASRSRDPALFVGHARTRKSRLFSPNSDGFPSPASPSWCLRLCRFEEVESFRLSLIPLIVDMGNPLFGPHVLLCKEFEKEYPSPSFSSSCLFSPAHVWIIYSNDVQNHEDRVDNNKANFVDMQSMYPYNKSHVSKKVWPVAMSEKCECWTGIGNGFACSPHKQTFRD